VRYAGNFEPIMPEPNPLVEIPFRIPFDHIRAEHVEPAIEELLRDARGKLDTLASDPEACTAAFELYCAFNTMPLSQGACSGSAASCTSRVPTRVQARSGRPKRSLRAASSALQLPSGNSSLSA